MSNHTQYTNSRSRSISQANNIQHTIKRNIGSSTTSLTAFSISQLDKVPVSLSPFEYASPQSSLGSSYFSGLVKMNSSNLDDRVKGSLIDMDQLNSEDLDFDTAYNMMNESLEPYLVEPPPQQHPVPRTPEAQFNSLNYKSPNTLARQRYYQENDQIYQDHRRAIIQAGLQQTQSQSSQLQKGQQQPQLQPQFQQQSPFQVSPHTRNLLHSVNNMTSAYQVNNNNGYELLSITESSALEKFLDSVVDDSKLNDLEKHWPSIDPMAKAVTDYSLPNLVTEGNKSRISQIPDLKLQKMNTDTRPMHPIPESHALSLIYESSPSGSPASNFASSSSRISPQVEPLKKKRGRKKKVVNLEEAGGDNIRQENKKPKLEHSDSAKLRKLMLTEEQKKLNHTESEKKRRAMIKNSYDNLLETIKLDKCYHIKYSNKTESEKKKSKRGNSRHAVMNCVINEIEWLLERNEELKKRLGDKLLI